MTPGVRVVRGEPDDLELAALVAGLAGAAHAHSRADHAVDPAADAEPAARARRRWRAAAGAATGAPPRGADAWRWSTVVAPRL